MKKALSFILSVLMTANLLLLCNFASFPAFAADSSDEISSVATPPQKLWGIVEGKKISAPESVATQTNIENLNLTPVWQGADGFEFGQKAVGGQVIAYTATYTAPDGYSFASSIINSYENTTLSEDKKTLTFKLYTYVIPADAIYIDDSGSNSTEDYAEGNLQKPYKTIDYALGLLQAKGGGTIVIVDSVAETTSGNTYTHFEGDYIITGWDAESVFSTTPSSDKGGHYYLRANTTFRDLTINFNRVYAGIYANGNSLTLGDKNYSDLNILGVVNAPQIFMTGDGGNYSNVGKLTVNSGSYSCISSSGFNVTNIDSDLNIEINNGNVSTLILPVHAGSSSGVHTVNGNINVTINGGTVTTIKPNGATYVHNGNTSFTINGGNFGNIDLTRSVSTVSEVNYPQENGNIFVDINGGNFSGNIKCSPKSTVSGTVSIELLDYNGDKSALLKKIPSAQFDVIKHQVVYLDQTNGNDSNDGSSNAAALATFTAALKKFANGVSGKIIIIGNATTAVWQDTDGRGAVVITGYNENASFEMTQSTPLSGDTTFENIKIINSKQYGNLFACGHKLVMGNGITSETTVPHYLQIGNGNVGATVESCDITINSGTYGLIYSGADFNGGSVTGNANLTINGGTFNGDIYAGGYVASSSKAGNSATAGTVGGKIGLYINGGIFNGNIYIGGRQYGTVGSIEAKIIDGNFKKNITVGPLNASGITSENVSFTTDILGNAIVEISGGSFGGKISAASGEIKGKSVIVATDGASVSCGDSSKFDYFVTASKKGSVKYDSTSDKFKITPVNNSIDISINNTVTSKTADNLYTLSGSDNNSYNIAFGGEVAPAAKFIITHPIAELTPITTVIRTGGANTYSEIGNCTVGNITWEPAHSKFKFEETYTATVTLTAANGLEFTDDFSQILINNGNKNNKTEYTLSSDKTQVTVKITFPKTEEPDLKKLASETANVNVAFTTNRIGENSEFFRNATVTLENVYDSTKTYSGTATENGSKGSFNAEVAKGIYNITVKKPGYLEAKQNAVTIDAEKTVDFGALIPGDIIGNNANANGDGIIDIDDFIIATRAFGKNAAARQAADINESGNVNVEQLGYIKSNFNKNTANNASKYSGLFQNTYYKLTVDKELTVGYIGGSIIQGAGDEAPDNEKYIDRMHQWFNENFPDAEIHSINAGISNTGTNFGIFRLNADLMQRKGNKTPDLVFIEFAVNDMGTVPEDVVEWQYESIIRNIYSVNPKADIVCLITALEGGYERNRRIHTKVANHYNIPIIDLGTSMSDYYQISGDCKVFTNDKLHPNGAGYEHYAKLTKNLLEKYIITAAPENPQYQNKTLPQNTLQTQLLTNPKAVEITDSSVTLNGSWTKGSSAVNSRIFGEDKISDFVSSSAAGDSLTFTFNGDAFGVMLRHTQDMGTFSYSIDGAEPVEYTSLTGHRYTHTQNYIIVNKLENKQHTVTITVTGKNASSSSGCLVSLYGLFFNESAN